MKKGFKRATFDLMRSCPKCLSDGVTVPMRASTDGHVLIYICQDCKHRIVTANKYPYGFGSRR